MDRDCKGHGQQDSDVPDWMDGHTVPAVDVPHMFRKHRGGRGRGVYRATICKVCESVAHHATALDMREKARSTLRKHAAKAVGDGVYPVTADAYAAWSVQGVTVDTVAARMRDALGQPCAGGCWHTRNGRIEPHLISDPAKMHMDVADPAAPLSLHNIVIMCQSCNSSKGRRAFADFIAERNVHKHAMQWWLDNVAARVRRSQWVMPQALPPGDQGRLF